MACMSENEVKRKLRKAGMSPEKTAKVIEALKKYREQLQLEVKYKNDLASEQADVAAMASLIGLKIPSNGKATTDIDLIVSVQHDILSSISKDSVDLNLIQNALNKLVVPSIDSIDTSDRNARAVAKIEARMAKAGITSRDSYIALQLAEELNEVLEVLYDDDVASKNILSIQKAAQKIIRFGVDTVIKDSDGNPTSQTNGTRFNKLVRDAGIDINVKNTDEAIRALVSLNESLPNNLSEPQLQLQDKSNSLLVPSRAPNGLQNSNVDFTGFDKKEEFHITVLGFPQGKELGEIFAKDPSKKAVVQKLINEADFSYAERPEIYKISRDIEQFMDWNNKELGSKMVHEEAIIQLVNAPGVKAFIDKINAELGTNFPVPFPHVSMAVKGTKFGIGIPNEAGFAKLNPELLTSSGSVNQIDKALNNKLIDILKKLYPEIKLEYTNDEIEYNDGSMNQEIDNSIKLGLKVIDALVDLASVKESKYGGESQAALSTVRLSNQVGIRKTLSGKGVPKEQIDFMFDYMKSNQIQNIDTKELAEHILIGLSTSVEVNTASRETIVNPPKEDHVSMIFDKFAYDLTWQMLSEANHDTLVAVVEESFKGTYGDSLASDAKSEFPLSVSVSDIQSVIDDVKSYEIPKAPEPERFVEPSRYYANLTVPGGTNYKEKEISTPSIIAPRKGHASFATDKGIGWYRVDDAVEGGESNTLPDNFIDIQGSEWTKINGVWNVLYKGDTEVTVRDDLSDAEAKISYGGDFSASGGTDTQTLRVLEMQSDMFQKMKDDKLDGYDSSKAFLQLLNTDNKWVKFFIQSIVQDSQKQGYEYIRFPAGVTAAKVEGHDSVQDRIDRIDKSIDDIKIDIKRLESNANGYSLAGYIAYKTESLKTEQRNAGNKYGVDSQEFRNYNQLLNDLKKSDAEVESKFGGDIKRYKRMNDFDETKLESRKEDLADAIASKAELKTQGLEKLAPIEGFYEIRVKNTLVKTYGQENIKRIADEHGNQWFELKLNSDRDNNTIMLQKQNGKIKGQANLEAKTVLISTMLQSQDTLPHEYAHHYISWFRDTPVVQAAIKKWGSEEALVQAIGEQSVKQEGAAYGWWKKFSAWLRNKFNSLDKASKEELAKLLTDAFLTRKDLTPSSGSNSNPEPRSDKRADNNEALSDKTNGKITTANIDDIIRGCL